MKFDERVQEIAKLIDEGDFAPAEINTHLNELLNNYNEERANSESIKKEFEKSQGLLKKTQQANLELLMDKTTRVEEKEIPHVEEEKSKDELERELLETVSEIGEI